MEYYIRTGIYALLELRLVLEHPQLLVLQQKPPPIRRPCRNHHDGGLPGVGGRGEVATAQLDTKALAAATVAQSASGGGVGLLHAQGFGESSR